jgi:hypothetical protein
VAAESRAYTADEMFRVLLSAWSVNYLVYRAMGATIKAQHWEMGGFWIFRSERWVDVPVDSVRVSASFEAFHPNTTALAGSISRSETLVNASSAEVKLQAGGVIISIPMPNEPSGGFGPAAPPGPGAGPVPASLPVDAVRATGDAVINGQIVICDEVFKR